MAARTTKRIVLQPFAAVSLPSSGCKRAIGGVSVSAAAATSCGLAALVQESYCAASAWRSWHSSNAVRTEASGGAELGQSAREPHVIASSNGFLVSYRPLALLAALAAVTTYARTVGEELTLQSLAVDAACRESQPAALARHIQTDIQRRADSVGCGARSRR